MKRLFHGTLIMQSFVLKLQKINKAALILISLIIIWGFNWPFSKIALAHVPPFWLAALRTIIATIAMFAFLGFTKQLTLPKKADIPVLISVSVLYMAAFTVLANIGLKFVDPGRSAILSYTSPLWVAPIATLFFNEKLSKGKLLGLILGISGVLVLFNPMTFNWHDRASIIGNIILIVSAITVAISILHMRYTQCVSTPLQLCPWQLLLASIILTISATIVEPHTHIHWTFSLINLMLYFSLLVTAFGYWGVMEVSQRLPAMKTSIFLLAVPMVSLISSSFIFHTMISVNTLISMGLIFTGLVFVARSS